MGLKITSTPMKLYISFKAFYQTVRRHEFYNHPRTLNTDRESDVTGNLADLYNSPKLLEFDYEIKYK